MAKFTRKAYLELYKDGVPVVASGRTSNRHTSIVEAGEHAEEHAIDIDEPGLYEVRIGTEVYYTVKINSVIFQSEADPFVPPADQAEIALSASAYSGNEQENISFTILRTVETSERVSVDWAITNATVTPNAGTVIFEIGSAQEVIVVTAGDIVPTEIGTLIISNPVNLSGGQTPALIAPTSAVFTVYEDPYISQSVGVQQIVVGQTIDVNQFITDPGGRYLLVDVTGLTSISTYSAVSRLITGLATGSETNVTIVGCR